MITYLAQSSAAPLKGNTVYLTMGPAEELPLSTLINLLLRGMRNSSPEDLLSVEGAHPLVAGMATACWFLLHSQVRTEKGTLTKEEILKAIATLRKD